MNLNPAAILALIGDLYAQIMQLQRENAELRQNLAPKPAEVAPIPSVETAL